MTATPRSGGPPYPIGAVWPALHRAAGTRLTLTHSGFTHANRWRRDQLAGGWRSNLLARRLPALLAGRAAPCAPIHHE